MDGAPPGSEAACSDENSPLRIPGYPGAPQTAGDGIGRDDQAHRPLSLQVVGERHLAGAAVQRRIAAGAAQTGPLPGPGTEDHKPVGTRQSIGVGAGRLQDEGSGTAGDASPYLLQTYEVGVGVTAVAATRASMTARVSATGRSRWVVAL